MVEPSIHKCEHRMIEGPVELSSHMCIVQGGKADESASQAAISARLIEECLLCIYELLNSKSASVEHIVELLFGNLLEGIPTILSALQLQKSPFSVQRSTSARSAESDDGMGT